jgi:hypothetical protein
MTERPTVTSPTRGRHGAAPHRGATGIRRVAVLALVVAALLLGSSLPSWATFSDTAAVTTTVTTATVVPPTNLTSRVKCVGSDAAVTLNWNASTSTRVSGYLIRVHFGGGAYQDQTTLAATATSWTGTTPVFYVNNYTITFTVWTKTTYGWSAESAHTARILC